MREDSGVSVIWFLAGMTIGAGAALVLSINTIAKNKNNAFLAVFKIAMPGNLSGAANCFCNLFFILCVFLR